MIKSLTYSAPTLLYCISEDAALTDRGLNRQPLAAYRAGYPLGGVPTICCDSAPILAPHESHTLVYNERLLACWRHPRPYRGADSNHRTITARPSSPCRR